MWCRCIWRPFINLIPSLGIKFLINKENSPPLSLCKISGTPSLENNSQRCWQIWSVSLVLSGKAQAYLLKQSKTVNTHRYPLLEKFLHAPQKQLELNQFESSQRFQTSALRELLFTLYLYTGLRPSVWGNLTSDNWNLRNLRYDKRSLSRDIGINIIGICISNYPVEPLKATVCD